MPEYPLSVVAEAFVISWKTWDEAATRISLSREIALKNGIPYYVNGNTLKRETEIFMDAKLALARELGLNHVHMMAALQELRRGGVDHAKAVYLVNRYLEDLTGVA